MDKSFKNFFIYNLLVIIVFSACEEAAIPIDSNITSTPLTIDTVSFPVINTISYQVPPDIGLHEYLYFGKKDEFSFLYNLIRFSSIDSTNLYTFDYYNDSLIIADSMKLIMSFASDSVEENIEFQLRYFPDYGDSVFNETTTNYTNFDQSIASSVISSSTMSSDSIDSVTTQLRLNFLMDTTIIKVFKDSTITNFNSSFLVELTNENLSEFKLFSANSLLNPPKLRVYYREFLSDSVVLDTSFHTYYSSQDVSIVDKSSILSTDLNNISVGLAKGLRSLILVDMEGWELPKRSIISSADLVYNRIDNDTLISYSISSYPITIQADFTKFNIFDIDPYEVDLNYTSSASILNNQLKINYRKIITEFGKGTKINYGFKLQSSPSSDPFKTIQFYNLNSNALYPTLRIIYVK
tara:strand:+ start:165 stop:1391 length:1227 start_codon:yes stop_codon:yes gene_type:complete